MVAYNKRKVSINSLLKTIGFLIIFFAPLDAIKIMGSYFSVYRILALLCFGIMFLAMFTKMREFRINISQIIIMSGLLVGNLTCILVSENRGTGFSYFLNDMLGFIIIVEFCCIYTAKDKDALLLTYVRSQYIPLLISIYVIVLHYRYGRTIATSGEFLFFSYEMSANSVNMLMESKPYLPSLFFPYATMPHFDISVGIASFICFYFYLGKRKKRYLVMGVIYGALVLLSAQKGPILAYIISILLFFAYYRKMKGVGNMIFFVVAGMVITFGVGNGLAKQIMEYTLLRFSEFMNRASVGKDRHVLLIYEAIYVWLRDLKSFLIGVGYSGHAMLNGKYTYVPETFLSSFFTLLAERGLLSVIPIMFYLKPIQVFWRRKEVLFNVSVFVVINFMFYEMRYVQTVWIIYGIVICCIYGISRNRYVQKSHELKNSTI